MNTITDLDNAIAALLVPVSLLSSLTPNQALLAFKSSQGSSGNTLNISCQFSPATSAVSALQWDLWLDSRLTLLAVSVGSAGSAAGKSAQMNPLGNGLFRIVIFGINQNPIGSGNLLNLSVQIAAGSHTGFAAMGSQNALASDPSGNPVALQVLSGGVTVL